MTVAVVATATAKPGKADELEAAFAKLLAPSRADAGCLIYDLHRSTTDPNTFMMYELWNSQAELDAHLQTSHLQAFGASVQDVLASDLDIATFAPVNHHKVL